MIGPALVGVLSKVEGGVEATEHVHAMSALGSAALLAGCLVLVFQPLQPKCNCCAEGATTPLLHQHTVSSTAEGETADA